MDKSTISLKNISKIYNLSTDVQVEALQDIHFEVKEGEFVSIMGPSGSGKSTLLSIIGCLDRPTKGTYLLEETEVAKLSDNQLAEIRLKKIGFVFQTFNLLPRITILQNIVLPLSYRGIAGKIRQKQGLELLERVKLKHRANHKPTELSGGEQQRVAIARALVNSPRLILADEPTGNLDSTSAEEVMDILCRLNEENKMTVVVITHNQAVAKRTKRVYHLKDGQIVVDEDK